MRLMMKDGGLGERIHADDSRPVHAARGRVAAPLLTRLLKHNAAWVLALFLLCHSRFSQAICPPFPPAPSTRAALPGAELRPGFLVAARWLVADLRIADLRIGS